MEYDLIDIYYNRLSIVWKVEVNEMFVQDSTLYLMEEEIYELSI